MHSKHMDVDNFCNSNAQPSVQPTCRSSVFVWALVLLLDVGSLETLPWPCHKSGAGVRCAKIERCILMKRRAVSGPGSIHHWTSVEKTSIGSFVVAVGSHAWSQTPCWTVSLAVAPNVGLECTRSVTLLMLSLATAGYCTLLNGFLGYGRDSVWSTVTWGLF